MLGGISFTPSPYAHPSAKAQVLVWFRSHPTCCLPVPRVPRPSVRSKKPTPRLQLARHHGQLPYFDCCSAHPHLTALRSSSLHIPARPPSCPTHHNPPTSKPWVNRKFALLPLLSCGAMAPSASTLKPSGPFLPTNATIRECHTLHRRLAIESIQKRIYRRPTSPRFRPQHKQACYHDSNLAATMRSMRANAPRLV